MSTTLSRNEITASANFATSLTINGSNNSDNLYASTANQTVNGLGGDDYLQSTYDGVTLSGGSGDDHLVSDANGVKLLGGSGNDILDDFSSNDNIIMNGGTGADVYYSASTGTHTMYIDNIDDVVWQSAGQTKLVISVDNYKVPYDAIASVDVSYVNGASELVYFIDSIDSGARNQGFFNIYEETNLFNGYGTGITIKYGFATIADHGETGFVQFSAQQKADIRIALQEYSSLADVTFIETTAGLADFKFYFDDLTMTDTASSLEQQHHGFCTCAGCAVKLNAEDEYVTLGYAYYGGDVHINSSIYADNDNIFKKVDTFNNNFTDDGAGYDTIIHEVGHVLGFKHSGQYGSDAGPFLPTAEENTSHSIMSYNPETYADNFIQHGIQDFDIATLHYKFGVNHNARTGNNTYDMTNTMYIWDGSGTDTITASNATAGVHLNLAPGSWNYVGNKADMLSADGQSFLGFDTSIEKAVGSGFGDVIRGNALANTLTGLGGNDKIYGNSGKDILYGGRGNDLLNGGTYNDTLYGNDDDDLLFGQDGWDRLYGQNGNDRLNGGNGNDTLFGGHGKDVLYGNIGNDILDGGTYNDILYGGQGNDLLKGQDGWDTLFGEFGADKLNGGNGNDKLFGGNGNDTLHGNIGEDSLDGGNDNDILYGGWDNDKLFGQNGNDMLFGESGNDRLNGGDGYDRLSGGSGIDWLYGNLDDDVLFGNSANDYLFGGKGDDHIYGGIGKDILYGEAGRDTFVFSSITETTLNAPDVIMDFESEWDKIYLQGIDANTTEVGDQDFDKIFTEEFTSAGQLIFKDGILSGNINDDLVADFSIEIKNASNLFSIDIIG